MQLAQRLATSFRGTMIAASSVGAISALAGLAAARLWGLAPGGTIVLFAAGLFVAAALLPRTGATGPVAHLGRPADG